MHIPIIRDSDEVCRRMLGHLMFAGDMVCLDLSLAKAAIRMCRSLATGQAVQDLLTGEWFDDDREQGPDEVPFSRELLSFLNCLSLLMMEEGIAALTPTATILTLQRSDVVRHLSILQEAPAQPDEWRLVSTLDYERTSGVRIELCAPIYASYPGWNI